MKDVVHAGSPESAATLFVIILTFGAMASTVLAGWASDQCGTQAHGLHLWSLHGGGRRGVHLRALSCHQRSAHGDPDRRGDLLASATAPTLPWTGRWWGTVLSSEETFARDMGVWNIGLTLPQVLAAVFGGWLIGLGIALGSLQLGYTFLFVGFVVFCVSGTVTVRYIKGVAR